MRSIACSTAFPSLTRKCGVAKGGVKFINGQCLHSPEIGWYSASCTGSSPGQCPNLPSTSSGAIAINSAAQTAEVALGELTGGPSTATIVIALLVAIIVCIGLVHFCKNAPLGRHCAAKLRRLLTGEAEDTTVVKRFSETTAGIDLTRYAPEESEVERPLTPRAWASPKSLAPRTLSVEEMSPKSAAEMASQLFEDQRAAHVKDKQKRRDQLRSGSSSRKSKRAVTDDEGLGIPSGRSPTGRQSRYTSASDSETTVAAHPNSGKLRSRSERPRTERPSKSRQRGDRPSKSRRGGRTPSIRSQSLSADAWGGAISKGGGSGGRVCAPTVVEPGSGRHCGTHVGGGVSTKARRHRRASVQQFLDEDAVEEPPVSASPPPSTPPASKRRMRRGSVREVEQAAGTGYDGERRTATAGVGGGKSYGNHLQMMRALGELDS